jgi:hypothetical protein
LELNFLTKEYQYQPEEFRKKDKQSIEKSHLLEVMTNKLIKAEDYHMNEI